MTAMQVKAPAFLVGKEGFDLKPMRVPVQRFFGQLEVVNEKERRVVLFVPRRPNLHRPNPLLRVEDIRHFDQVAGLGVEPAQRGGILLVGFAQQRVLVAAAHLLPVAVG